MQKLIFTLSLIFCSALTVNFCCNDKDGSQTDEMQENSEEENMPQENEETQEEGTPNSEE